MKNSRVGSTRSASAKSLNSLQSRPVRPVRPYQRFNGFREAGSGSDPDSTFLRFIKLDIARNIDVSRDTRTAPDLSKFNSSRWAIGTTKHSNSKVDASGNLPRPETASESVIVPPMTTDPLNTRSPKKARPKSSHFTLSTSRYSANSQTHRNIWTGCVAPVKNVANRSSVTFDIIHGGENQTSGALFEGLLERSRRGRKIGVT